MRTNTRSRRALTGLAAATGLAGVWAAGCSPSTNTNLLVSQCVELPPAAAGGAAFSIPGGAISAPIVITAAGRYVVRGDITLGTAFGGNAAIAVSTGVSGVTIDLNGFTLNGVGGPAGVDGVVAESGTNTVHVINGTVTRFSGDGVDLWNATDASVTRVTSNANTGDGLRLGTGGRSSNSKSEDNEGDGLEGDDDTMITGTYVANNRQWGINLGGGSNGGAFGCTITTNGSGGVLGSDGASLGACDIENNTGPGVRGGAGLELEFCTVKSSTGAGIEAGNGSRVSACEVRENTGLGVAATTGAQVDVEHSVIAENSAGGIEVGPNSVVQYNDISSNGGIGINIATVENCYVTGNTLRNNTSKAIKGRSRNAVTGNFATNDSNSSGGTNPYQVLYIGTIDLWGPQANISSSPTNPNANVWY